MSAIRRSAAALCCAALLTLVAACSSSGSSGSSGRPATDAAGTTTTTANLNPPATSDVVVGKARRRNTTYGVGRTDVTLVDPSRGTPADRATKAPATDDRTLPTVILYPTDTASDDASRSDHPVAAGRFPLVVFSHGVTASGPAYVGVLKKLAAQGYVVALPTFPLTSGAGGWSNLTQVQQQPGDVSFIITKLLAESASDTGLLSGHLDPSEIAAAGHSLGAITSLFFEHSCCRDVRIKAIVAVSGTPFPGPTKADHVLNVASSPPLLMLHGKKDKTLRYEPGSATLFTTLTKVPRALVTFPDKGHVDILGSPSLMPSIIAFLDMELRHDDTGWRALTSKLAKDGDAGIQVGGGLAPPS
jgi:predicted dienelactone hydrolase